MSAIKFSLTSSQDKDLDDLTKTGKYVEEEGNMIVNLPRLMLMNPQFRAR